MTPPEGKPAADNWGPESSGHSAAPAGSEAAFLQRQETQQRLEQWQALLLGQPAQAEQQLLEFLHAQEQDPAASADTLTHATLLLAGCAFYQGNYTQMLSWAQLALRRSRQFQLPLFEARALNSIGLVHQRTGDLVQAMSYFIESLKLAEEYRDLAGQCRALLNIALVHTSLDEYETALKLHEQALLAARVAQVPAFIADALYGRAEDYYALGHHARALELATETLNYARQHQLGRLECGTRAVLSLVLLKLGRLEASLQNVHAGQQLARQIHDQESLLRLETIEAQVLLALGDLAGARQHFENGLRQPLYSQPPQTQPPYTQPLPPQTLCNKELAREVHAGLAEVFERQGDFRLAYEHLAQERLLAQDIQKTEAVSRHQQLAVRMQLEAHQGRGDGPEVPRRALWSEVPASPATAPAAPTQGPTEGPPALPRPGLPETHDLLTGVVSRQYFQGRVVRALELVGGEEHLALLFVAVDHWQTLGETYGQAVAAEVLREVARRLSDNVRSGDLVGRMSQGEFMVMLGHLAYAGDLNFVMDKLLVAVRQPMNLTVEGQQYALQVTVSLGGVVAPHDGLTLETLYHHADLALRQVQHNGRNSALRFQPYMSAEEQQKRTLESELRGAVGRGELQLHYQGQFDLQAGQGKPLIGYEALVRWQHPRLGLVAPSRFIPLAEESRLILDIGRWVLQEACRQAAEWGFARRGLSMSVNVSAVQFGQPDFVQSVRDVLVANGLNGENLTLELTETMVHEDEQRAAQNIRELQALGVQVALDDFGTGYSSLSMLQNLPFRVLKIDRSFLNDLNRSSGSFQRAWTLLELLVRLAHNLDMEVVAEGLEQEEQWDLLQELGCNSGQGYWLSRPLPAEQAALLL